MRPRPLSLALLLALPLALSLPGLAAAKSPAPADAALVARIDALAAEALRRPGAAGLSIAVARDGEIVLDAGYGLADLENRVPATKDSVFRIASVTKQFTAAAILRLAERGKLSLDDDVTKFVDFPTQGRRVTIRQLMAHVSGIPSYTDVPGFFDTGTTRDLTPAQVLDPVRSLPFEFEPGTRWRYSNTGYHLLGMVLEKVSGAPYASHVQDELFTPLRLTHSRHDVFADVIPGRAHGYGVIDGRPVNAPYLSMTVPFSAGGLLSSAGDLVRWDLALASGRVVSPESYVLMTTAATLADGSAAPYGLGLFVSEVDGRPNVMHEGGIPGFNSILVHFTKEPLTIAVISNSSAVSAGQLAAEIARASWEAPTEARRPVAK